MTYIGLGILGFVVFHLVDLAAIWRLPAAKPLFWTGGCALVVYGFVMACLEGARLSLPLWATVLGWLLLAAAGAQVGYSLFLNLPFRQTYLKTGVGDRLITTGLYALVRHPGVWGLAVLMLALVLVSHARLMLIAAPVWLVTDIIVVAVQDYLFFGRMFPGYREYRRTTPMLIPSPRSIGSFLTQLRLSKSAQGGN